MFVKVGLLAPFIQSYVHSHSIGTSLQMMPSLWAADFLQNWRQEILQIMAKNS